MSLPNIDINLGNGQIGTVLPNEDRTIGVMAAAVANAYFSLEKAYLVKGMVDVANLGILPSVDNYGLYKFCLEFYKEAGEGTELWIYGCKKNADGSIEKWFVPDAQTGKTIAQNFLDSVNGKIRRLFAVRNPDGNFVPDVRNGLHRDVWYTLEAAHNFAVDYTRTTYCPIRIAIEGTAFNGDRTALNNLLIESYNRVSVLIGDTEPKTSNTFIREVISKQGIKAEEAVSIDGEAKMPQGATRVYNYGAAMGVLAGRMAAYPIHNNIGKVKNGSLKPLKFYIVDTPVELYDTAALHDKSYITFRKHPSKSGYYFSDDPQACSIEDDYHSNARGDVIDKAYRLTYLVQVEELLDEAWINEDGTPDAIWAKDLEGRIESYIMANMGDQLQYRVGDTTLPVKVFIDPNQNVATTSKLKTVIRVKPWGYIREMETELSYTLSK
ncbi:hypothetical protein EIB75_00905 [Epilithonimonas vandammei]|uniref:DUF2586 family protein n=1 Tax=Epilithonimonas vandammei TaxID=2487072 RepID=A0A3G8ZJ33_9FLAO|nr:DUF2586 family protein [Epilithonimonas vandammei]AZI53901.1 hypothetical protein EIB75_00905 [Epilithonimonas vandammei]